MLSYLVKGVHMCYLGKDNNCEPNGWGSGKIAYYLSANAFIYILHSFA